MTGTITGALLSFLLLYKYWALFALEFISALGPPLPSAAALVASGMFASQGYFSLALVLIAGFLGNALGDISLFFLARRFRKSILRFLKIKEKGNSGFIGKIEKYLYSHSWITVAASRLSGAGSPAVSALSGISDMPAATFVTAAIAGETVYTLLYAFIGYFVGVEWEDISNFALPAIIVTIAIIAAFFLYKDSKKR